MKSGHRKITVLCLFAAAVLLLLFLAPTAPSQKNDREKDKTMRGLWVATVHNIDFPSQAGLPEAALKSELFEIVQKAAAGGYNAIFFQVRPSCDAFYKSDIFPYSKYMGTEFDALGYLCTLGKKYDIDIHAWINPYRVTASEGDEPPVSAGVVMCGGKYYLDPGEPSNIELVCEGVREIVENYDVAGIHFDDYFYPSKEFDDSASYAQYGGGMEPADWRRKNTYALISAVSETIAAANDGVAFGVSPVGIWRNASADERGSLTNGYSGYDDIYADALSWAEDSLVDYLAPQIYWEHGNKAADFSVLCDWWEQALEKTKTELYIGLAAYKKNDWSEGEYELQKEQAEKLGGYIVYNYSNCEFPLDKEGLLTIALPESGTVIDDNSTYVVGYADPSLDVLVNGVSPYRTISGYYAAYIPLADGENVITVTAGAQSKKISVSVNHAGGGDAKKQISITSKENTVGRIKYDETVTRASPSSSGTRLGTLCAGVTDNIVAQSGNYSQLKNGRWVATNALEISEGVACGNAVSDIIYSPSEDSSSFEFSMNRAVPYDVTVTPEAVTITLDSSSGTPCKFNDGENPMISTVDFRESGTDAVYILRLKREIGGYSVKATEKGLDFRFLHKKELAGSLFPLKGFKIYVDAGHGGEDGGASSPGEYDEADLNLMVAKALYKKLKKYGAEVEMSRTEDVYMSLDDRAAAIRNSGADLALSIHHNSAGYSRDVTAVYGAMTLYSEDLSLSAAKAIQDGLVAAAGRADRGAKWQGLAVCRVTQCPTVLAELGFICNPFEYEELSSESVILTEAQGLADGIVNYFKK